MREIKFAGYKDANGAEIRIGDILRGKNFDSEITEFEVFQEEEGFIAKNKNEIYDVSASIFHEYEIIRNIYENPELLEAKG